MRDSDEIVDIHRKLSEAMFIELSDANRAGEDAFRATLKKWNWKHENEKQSLNSELRILVVGESRMKETELKKVAEEIGIDPDFIEFELGYKTNFRYDTLKGNDTYSDVLFGPLPHSQKGKGSSSSIIVEMENHPSLWPNPVRLNVNGTLKITKESFAMGLLQTDAYSVLQQYKKDWVS